jgi:hypothetical protein
MWNIGNPLTNLLPCVLIASTVGSVSGTSRDDIATLARSDPIRPGRAQQVEEIRTLLRSYVNDVNVWTYRKHLEEEIRKDGAWGKGALSAAEGSGAYGFYLGSPRS